MGGDFHQLVAHLAAGISPGLFCKDKSVPKEAGDSTCKDKSVPKEAGGSTHMATHITLQNVGPQVEEQHVDLQEENQRSFPDDLTVFQAMVEDNFQLDKSTQLSLALGVQDEREQGRGQGINKETARLHAKFFSSGNPNNLNVSVPARWVNFLTAQLLKPNSFGWIRSLLSSGIISALDKCNSGSVQFSVPTECPQFNLPCLSEVRVEDPAGAEESAMVVPPKKRSRKRTTIYIESEVRRSPRLKSTNQGFKARGCKGKNCFVCNVVPPTLSSESIKRIASKFCDIAETDVNAISLQERKRTKHPVARARILPLEDTQFTSTNDTEKVSTMEPVPGEGVGQDGATKE